MAWEASHFAWAPEELRAVRLAPGNKESTQATSGGSAEGQGSQPWTQAGSDSSDAGGAKQPRKASASGGKKVKRTGRAPAVCQVDGCGVNLDSGKPFYRLQRICERHARAAVITDSSGAALRFCQQCTRLHPIDEFEGPKRSCVAALKRRMARKQRQQAQDMQVLDAVEAAAGKRRARGRTTKSPRQPAAAGGSGGGGGPDSGGAPFDWSSNSHGSGSYGDARSNQSGGSAGVSGGGSQQGALPLGTAVDLAALPGMVPQPLPHSGPMAMPPLDLAPVRAGSGPLSPSSGPLSPSQLPGVQWAGGTAGSTAGGPFNPFALGGQAPAAAAQLPPPGAPAGLMDWTDTPDLLSPATVRQLLQDDTLLGGGGAVLPPAPAVPPAPSSNPAAAPGQPILRDDELERLLHMDPDDLAGALLAATDAGTSWPGQAGEAGLGSTRTAASGSGASGSTTVSALASGMSAPRGLGVLGLPAGPAGSTGGTAVPPAPMLVPPAAVPWGSPERLRQGVLGLVLSSPPQSAPMAGAAPPVPPATTAPLPASTAGMQPQQLPPFTLPPANWAGAQAATSLLQTAAAPVEEAVGDALALPPQAEMLVIRFSLKMYGLYPDQLPPQLQVELQEAVTLFPTVLQGAVRSGCTHLTASMLVTGEEEAALAQPDGAAAALLSLLRSWTGGARRPPWQLPRELPLLRVVAQAETASAALLLQPLQVAGSAGGSGSGRLLAASGGAICPLAPSAADQRLQLALAGPPATTVGAARGQFRLRCPDWQQLLLAGGQQGAGVAAAGGGSRRVLHCRSRGHHVAAALLWPGQAYMEAGSEESSESPSPHTPVVRNSRNSPVWEEVRLQVALQHAAAQPAAGAEQQEEEAAPQQEEEGAPEQQAAAAPAAARQQQPAQPEQAGPGEGSEAGSPAASEPEGDSEAEAAEEALTLRLLRAATSAEAWVPQALRQWGLYEFELAQGARLGPAVPVLVLPDSMAAVAAELCQLAAAEARHPGVTTRVLRLLSFVLTHLERQHQPAPLAPGAAAGAAAAAQPLPPAALARLAASARWLCTLCVRCRWPALLRALLPATTVCGAAPAEVVAAMDSLLLPAGLLASAAAANSAPLLQALGDWAVEAGHTWRPQEAAANGMTALHYAAALGPSLSAEAAAALAAAVGAAQLAQCWQQARAFGWTPRMVAHAAANQALASLLDPLVEAAAAGESQPTSGEQALSAASPSGSGGGSLQPGAAKAGKAAAAAEADEAAALLLQEQYYALELELEKKGGGGPGGPDELDAAGRLGGLPRLPASAAELRAWEHRPLSPALLALVGAAAVLIVVGLSAALRAGLYD